MNERYSEEVKAILEAAQQQAVMNYHQELTTAHVLAALCGSDGFFKYLLQSLNIDENAFSNNFCNKCKFDLFYIAHSKHVKFSKTPFAERRKSNA